MEVVPVLNLTFYYPSRDGRWKHVTIRTILGTILPLITLEGEYDEYRTLRFQGLGLIRSPSTHLNPTLTWPRPTDDQGLRDTGLGVFSPSHPPRHHGVRGWPVILGARRYSNLHSDRQNFTSKTPPTSLPPLTLLKGRQGTLQRGNGEQQTTKNQSPSHQRDQHLKQSPLYSHFFSETWDRFPLSQLVTPTQALRCKKKQYSPSLDVGPSFARTRINLRVLSLHHHPD
jgi:hypothetical protein